MIEIIRKIGRIELLLREEIIGSDRLLILTGGEPHLGAAAMGVHDNIKNRASASVLTSPGHRDQELALYGAQKICSVTQVTIIFIVGIHLDNITKDEIRTIVQTSKSMIDAYIDKLSD